jgi:DNA-directed RNA polymerase subunit F
MPKEIIEEEEITLPMVKKILGKRSKEGELSFQQTITLEHASTFSKMAPAVSVKLVERLQSKFEISRSDAVQIANIAPTSIEELRTILDVRTTDLTDEQLIEIVDMVIKARS